MVADSLPACPPELAACISPAPELTGDRQGNVGFQMLSRPSEDDRWSLPRRRAGILRLSELGQKHALRALGPESIDLR